ncbi:SDR family oxidoreductase [Candidatus Synchoanobacter obligatus]|uniref:SDR family oxidoreductase n=1 Tax=Candidatus Synchoanobacter obligatus TaxID=2919597 RepID=A0ABT1L632_9GAMM|nr:SDR family oxidoreductase [Candidatus Synchoanobacter obligatus]MCP8352549.1 SDR family oxidoreductase [Candidatus Synchoanobacter obligatus]
MMKQVCITGANRGIGLALTRYLADNNHIFCLCRKRADDLVAIPNTTIIEDIDINHHSNRLAAIKQLPNLDLVILNAGILQKDSNEIIEHEQTLQQQLQTNAISPLIFARMLIPHLKPNAKIVLMTSRMGSMSDNSSGQLDGYRMSKAALNAAGCNLAHDLKEQGIGVFLIHPGYIKTEMTNNQGYLSPEEAAQNICKLISTLTLENTGQFWHAEGHKLPW